MLSFSTTSRLIPTHKILKKRNYLPQYFFVSTRVPKAKYCSTDIQVLEYLAVSTDWYIAIPSRTNHAKSATELCRGGIQLVNEVVVLFVSVEFQVGQSDRGKHLADKGYVGRRAQAVATTTLIVAVAREVVCQPLTECHILSREHLRLHATEAAGIGDALGRAELAAVLTLQSTHRTDDGDTLFARNHCIPRHMAQAKVGHRALRMDAQREGLGHSFVLK